MTQHFEWGRTTKGALPGRGPAWSILTVLLAVVAGSGMGAYAFYRNSTGLERWYFLSYMRSAVAKSRSLRGNGESYYQVLDLVDDRHPDKTLATATDNDASVTVEHDGSLLLRYTDKWANHPHLHGVIRQILLDNGVFHDWLKQNIYGGEDVLELFKFPAEMGGATGVVVLVCGLFLAVPADRRRAEQRRNGRRIKGSKLLTTAQFNRMFRGDGIGWINEAELNGWKKKAPVARIPREAEANHLLLAGTTGAGKTTALLEALWQIEQRGEVAVIYDPDGYFLSRFYRSGRGDVILNPLDARGGFWHPGDEVSDMAEALTVADSFFPTGAPQSQEYFHEGAKKVLAHLLTFKPTPEELTRWMAHPEEIDRRLAGSPRAMILGEGAPQQRSGILGSLSNGADSFGLLITAREAEREGKPRWSSRQWAEHPKGWVFLTSRTELRKALRPLSSLWFDLIVLRLLSRDPGARTPVWCVLDELASLNYLPQLHTALTEARRYNLRLMIGFQDKGQVETRYGHDAGTILGMPKSKMYLRAGEAQAARWVSDNLGEIEVERITESHTHGQRRTRTETRQKAVEKLVLSSEILALPDRHGYLQHEGHILPLSFPYREIKPTVEPFVRRELPKHEPPAKPEPSSQQGNLPYFS